MAENNVIGTTQTNPLSYIQDHPATAELATKGLRGAEALKPYIPEDVDPNAMEPHEKQLHNVQSVLSVGGQLAHHAANGKMPQFNPVTTTASAVNGVAASLLLQKVEKALGEAGVAPDKQKEVLEHVQQGLHAQAEFNHHLEGHVAALHTEHTLHHQHSGMGV